MKVGDKVVVKKHRDSVGKLIEIMDVVLCGTPMTMGRVGFMFMGEKYIYCFEIDELEVFSNG